MQLRKKLVTGAVTLGVIAATAHLMQNGGAVSALVVPEPEPASATLSAVVPMKAPGPIAETPATAPDPAIETEIADVALLDEAAEGPLAPVPLTEPDMPEEAEAPAPLPVPSREPGGHVAPETAELPATAAEPGPHNEYGLACDIVATAAPRAAAMVRLTVTAPCRADARITVRHESLLYSARLDGLGTYSADVPALVADAAFKVTFPDGGVAEARTAVPLAAETERVALLYNGKTGLQIHALEFGADYGDPGHVWKGNAGTADAALKLGGGYLTALGDTALELPFMAEIYTLPADATMRDGVVRLSVEAEVTEDNCGRDIAGQTLQKGAGGAMTPVSLTLSMPGCDAVGEFLVLKNLLRDLKIASN